MRLLKLEELLIPQDRIRLEYDEDGLIDLAEDIALNGLYHAPTVRYEGEHQGVLVSGERRVRAISLLYAAGVTIRFDNADIPLDTIPTVSLGELPADQAIEAELNENLRRLDLSWVEQTKAIARLHELRKSQEKPWSPQTLTATAREVQRLTTGAAPTEDLGPGILQVRQALTLAQHLDDPEVTKATSKKEALKVVERKERDAHNKRLAEELGVIVPHERHTLLRGDCLVVSGGLVPETYDCVLTDPFYGIDAQDFGTQSSETHKYEDTYERWLNVMPLLAHHAFRLCKPQAHAYVFCDIRRFFIQQQMWRQLGWYVWDTPLIWVKNGGILPRPEHGPRRIYEAIMYAIKGDKKVERVSADVVFVSPSHTTGHAAEKPVPLFVDLLSRSCRPGDRVIDFMCGSGTIFPAANKLSLRATGIEDSPESFAMASKRIGEMP